LYFRKKQYFLFVLGFTCPFPGAGWWRVFNFARNFRKQGHICAVLSCFLYNPQSFRSRSFNFPTILQNEKISIYNILPFVDWISHPIIMFVNSIFVAVVSFPALLILRPTVIVISIPPADLFPPIFLLSKIMNRKIVIDYRDEFEDYLKPHANHLSSFYRFYKRFLAALYKRASLVASVTPEVADTLRKRNIGNVMVIHDGVDTRIFQPYDKRKMRSEYCLPQKAFVIAFLGNVYTPYRVDIAVRALAKLIKSDPKRKYLLILAGGGDVKSILDLAGSLGISDSVKYFGIVDNPAEIAKLLSTADCGIIPYDDNPLWQRTYSTKLFEYCSVGLPIIATVHKGSALDNIINLNQIGLSVTPVNIAELASGLKLLVDDKPLRNKMRTSTLEFAKAHDKERVCKNLLVAIENSEGPNNKNKISF
jgi:glycosyltransferase involved in cell wall biosynthesis